MQACPEGAIRYSQDHRLATNRREDLILRGEALKLAEALDEKRLPVDLFIPGWPPHPLTILDGLLRLLGRLEEKRP